MAHWAARKPQGRTLRIVSISGVTIGTAVGLMAAATGLVGLLAMKVVATGAADVLARMI